MSTRNLLNLLLLAIGTGLVLLIVYQPGLAPEDEHISLTDIDPTSIHTILIESEHYPPVAIKKQAGRWQLVGDKTIPAAEFQVSALTRILQASVRQQYSPDTLDLAALGLDPPRATLTLNETVILIGDTDALEHRRYVLINNLVQLVDDQYQHLINADWTNFVSRQLLPEQETITQITLPEYSLTMVDNKWQLTPESSTVSADDLQNLIDRWKNAAALYVRRYQPADAMETVIIEFNAEIPSITLQVVSHAPGLVLARPELGIQYHLTGGYESLLFQLPEISEPPLLDEEPRIESPPPPGEG